MTVECVAKDPFVAPDSWPVEDLSVSKGPFGWICLGGSSPLPPDGTCTHCIRTDSRPAAPGAPLWDGSRTVARSERCTAMLSMSQTTGARTRAICRPFHLHTHLKLCQQLPPPPPPTAPFCPFEETNPPPSTGPWPPELEGSAGWTHGY